MDIKDITQEKIASITSRELKQYSDKDQKMILKILEEVAESGESATLNNLWSADYEEIPVSIDTFLDDNYYIGQTGKSIYPAWREELRSIFDPNRKVNINETILSGAIGIGKTQIAVIGIAYMIYRLLCLKNPQEYYGVPATEPITIVLINVSLTQSNIVAYAKLQGILQESPWFLEHGEIYESKSKVEYIPGKNISIIVGSKQSHIVGTSVFCFPGDTEVETAEGYATFQDLATENSVKMLQFNTNTKQSEVSDTGHVELTKYVDELIEVELDDGQVFRCTPEQPFLVHDDKFGYKYMPISEITTEDLVTRKDVTNYGQI